MVVYKIDRRGGWVQKSFTRTDPDLQIKSAHSVFQDYEYPAQSCSAQK